MAHETPKQKAVIGRVMAEWKAGTLGGGGGGLPVRSQRQAVAIALSEAGASNRQTPAQNRRRLRQARTGDGPPTRAALYAEAKRRGIPGRSRMTKAELARALS